METKKHKHTNNPIRQTIKVEFIMVIIIIIISSSSSSSSSSSNRILVGKPEGKRPLGRPRRRWVDNIRMDLQKVGCGYVDWIGLAQDRNRWRTLVSAVMNLRVP